MKVQILSNDNGSCTNTLLTVNGDYNPQNKVFYRSICTIEEDDFIDCFDEDKRDKVFEQMQKGKIIFDVNKNTLLDKAKKIFSNY